MVSRRYGPCDRCREDRGWHTALRAEVSVGLADEGTGLGGLVSDGSVTPRGVGGDVCPVLSPWLSAVECGLWDRGTGIWLNVNAFVFTSQHAVGTLLNSTD